MNTFRLATAAFAAIAAFASCSDKDIAEATAPEQAPTATGTHYITINTNNAGLTRTEIVPDGNGFTAKWKVGDKINLFEVITGTEDGYPLITQYASEPLADSDIKSDGSASFRVAIKNENATLGNKFQYIASYPYTDNETSLYPTFCEYYDLIDENEISDWKQRWNYTGTDPVESHPWLNVIMPDIQKPTSTSFDPDCDMLLSGIITQDAQISEVASLPFARAGTVICITCKGLDAYKGQKISAANFKFGYSYGGNQIGEYDPVANKVMYYKGFPFTLYPQDVTIQDDGTAQLWLRGYSGTLNDWCSLGLTVGGEVIDEGGKGGITINGGTTLVRAIKLNELGRTIKFEEGGMTKFGVTDFLIGDLFPWIDIFYCANDNLDGFTASWNHLGENISKYTCRLVKPDGVDEQGYTKMTEVRKLGDAIINGNTAYIDVEGITDAETYIEVTAHAKEGHCFNKDNIEYISSTEYSTNRLVNLGEESSYPVWFDQMYYQSLNENGKRPEEEWDNSKEYIWDYSSDNLKFGYCHLDFETNSNGIILTSNEANTDWYVRSLHPYYQIQKIELMFDDATNQNATVWLGNTVGGKDITVEPSVMSGTSNRTLVYDFSGESERYKYFTIGDGGKGGVAKLFSIKIYYKN